MISSLSGAVRYKGLNSIVVDVSGIGYKVAVSLETALDVVPGSFIFLWTHLAVRENSLDLFGFTERESLEIFELLISISGIGPKTALGILNAASPSTLRQAVAEGDTSYLTRVSGIGKKNAEKIVLELKDKLKISGDEHSARHHSKADTDALEALISLGYSERDAREALRKTPKEDGGASEKVKQALKILSSN